jgi:glutathione synthase/RimK-type ligase-like ATP-grasp enzyme
VQTVPFVWDEEDPLGLSGCLIRSVSDYNAKYNRFIQWVRQMDGHTPLWNPAEMILWNADKSYLLDLEKQGVPTIPTAWMAAGSTTADLVNAMESRGWTDAIVKPVIGLGAQNLHRVELNDPNTEKALAQLHVEREVLVQPFLPSVRVRGETSLIYIGGELTHTVRKLPASGDFRVQKPWGGWSEDCEPSPAELDTATLTLSCLDSVPLYARVDLIADAAERPLLIELELIEPDLFFRHEPAAAAQLAEAIVTNLEAQ